MELDNSNVSKHLGKQSDYVLQYDKTLLVREPRQSNRTYLGINDNNLPFVGFDIWNGYEVSYLNQNGIPQNYIAKVVYSADSKYIVESKSMKLYWNSFNTTKLSNVDELEQTAGHDLSELLETDVQVKLFSNTHCIQNIKTINNDEFITLEDVVSSTTTTDVYHETPSILEIVAAEDTEYKYHSTLLKSNCRVTRAPDWGDVYITISGNKTVTPESLLKYIISFRNECHFHEEVTECIYKRLYDLLSPNKLIVKCLYTRRGGWSIEPFRASDKSLIDNIMVDANCVSNKTPKQ